MEQHLSRQHSNSSNQSDVNLVDQLADMKDQTEYIKQFRVALSSTLDEVKHLRTELAQEKSKVFEVLHSKATQPWNHPSHQLPNSGLIYGQLANKLLNDERRRTTQTTAVSSNDPIVHNTEPTSTEEISRVIAESEIRLDRVRDAVTERKEKIRDLRKKLQKSSSILVRRETKLEEKINEANDLKKMVQNLSEEKSNLQQSLHAKDAIIEEEMSRVDFKNKEIRDLLNKMSHMEVEMNNMYRRMCDRDQELHEAKNQLWSQSSSCHQCSWMREYIRRLEYKLQRYDYASARNYHGYNNRFSLSPAYIEKDGRDQSQWAYDSQHTQQTFSGTSLYSYDSPENFAPQSSYKQPAHPSRTKLSEIYKRQQAINRQRHQEFRNAAQVLSPIREDVEDCVATEDDTKPKAVSTERTGSASYSSGKEYSYSVSCPANEETSEPPVSCETDKRHTATPSVFPNHKKACTYFSIKSGENEKHQSTEPVMARFSPTYLHISTSQSMKTFPQEKSNNKLAEKDHNCGGNSSLVNGATGSQKHSYTDYAYNNEHTPVLNKSIETTVGNDSSYLHSIAVENPALSATLLKNINFSPVRSLPSLGSLASPSGSAFSTTDGTASDTPGCSSDSGVVKQSHKKLVKTRRSKRKPGKYIFFRNHKIDVMQFSMPEFRHVMWSTCNDEKAGDDFIEFLASEAKRLQSDPQWADKHTLGTPEDWLSLKGSY